jgi:hypothetical protein
MKYAGILLVLFLTQFSLGQNAQTQMPGMADSMHKAGCMMGKHDAGHEGMENRMMCPQSGMMENHMMWRQKGMCENGMMGFADKPPCCPMMRSLQGMQHHPLLLKLILLKLLLLSVFLCVYLAVNILLTVIVATDMKRRNCVNGLWIPLLLLAGIPVSVIYGLFRIGDIIKETKV